MSIPKKIESPADCIRVEYRNDEHDAEFFYAACVELWGGKNWSTFMREMARRGVEMSRGGFLTNASRDFINRCVDDKLQSFSATIEAQYKAILNNGQE